MEKIQDFSGAQYSFTTTDPAQRREYDAHNVEYATSTHQVDHDMFPGLIAFPRNDDDIKKAVKYAKSRGYPVSVMSGGHQYSGACSTHGKGIQLNLSSTYKSLQDLSQLPQLPSPDENKTQVYASVSHSLGEFNKWLRAHRLFVPHGQCAYVHLGGHAQTGGYGQLARSFGLLGDHIWGIRMINHDGEIQEVTRASNEDLFNAILGGSPGNFGVITHYTIEVYRDTGHDFSPKGPSPHGYKGLWLYSEVVLKQLLNEVAVMADNPEVPRNFDLCVSVLSSTFPMFKLMPELMDDQEEIDRRIGELIGGSSAVWPACIVLYAQWVPMNAEDNYTPQVDAWFQKFRDLKHKRLRERDIIEPMSEMTGEWIFHNPREFNHPYNKRTYMTNSTTLVADKWVDQVAAQIHQVVHRPLKPDPLSKNCYLSVQIQCYGGKYSQFYANRDNGTSYSWRDSTVCQVLDCFYKAGEEGKALAKEWQEANDKLMCGKDSSFSKQDKRVLWASYGDWDMSKSWPFYYEDQAKYERIGKQRYLADPQGTFTPNPFNVTAVKN